MTLVFPGPLAMFPEKPCLPRLNQVRERVWQCLTAEHNCEQNHAGPAGPSGCATPASNSMKPSKSRQRLHVSCPKLAEQMPKLVFGAETVLKLACLTHPRDAGTQMDLQAQTDCENAMSYQISLPS